MVSRERFEKHGCNRSSPIDVFSGKSVLKICSKFTGESPRRIVISGAASKAKRFV